MAKSITRKVILFYFRLGGGGWGERKRSEVIPLTMYENSRKQIVKYSPRRQHGNLPLTISEILTIVPKTFFVLLY